MADLSRRVDAVVTRIGADEIEVSLLGSRSADADFEELRQRLGAWGRGGAIVRDGSPASRAIPTRELCDQPAAEPLDF